MYRTKDGEEIFIIDGHVHLWDGSKANQRNVHGSQFIDCFYAYHSNLSSAGIQVGEGEVLQVRAGNHVPGPVR